MKRACMTTLLLSCVVAVPAFADSTIDAKIQCQVEYGRLSEMGIACQRGVELASRAPDKVQETMGDCVRDSADTGRAAACQRGVTLHARFAGQVRGDDKSGFSYSWKQGRGAAQIEIGDYQFLGGDAEKSINDCMRAFEGSSTPPSCLSGFTAQHKPPAGPPASSQLPR